MTTPVLGTFGTKVDLLIRQGATFGPTTATLRNPDTSAVNLTGATIRGQIRRQALDADVVKAFTCTITNAAGGVFTFGLSDADTAAIPAGEGLLERQSRYVYDIEMLDSAGRVLPLMYGDVTVLREVTR